MSLQRYSSLLEEALAPGRTLGLIGVGVFGETLREYALARGMEVLLCDPPRAQQEADELKDSFFELWGNGMGGCNLTGAELDNFLPMNCLARADVIAVQVPLVTDGPWPTRGLVNAKFLAACRPDVKIFCFSPEEVVAEESRVQPNIRFME